MISSWNVQGGFGTNRDLIKDYISQDYPNILLLQEQGAPETTGLVQDQEFKIGNTEFVAAVVIKDPTADNQRCTTAICVERNLYRHVVKGGTVYYGAYRPLCYVQMASEVVIATIHAIANSADSVPQVKKFLDVLNGYETEVDAKFKSGMDWILMGDFNSEPESYPIRSNAGATHARLRANYPNKIEYSGSISRGRHSCYIMYDECSTQGPNGKRYNKYDYVFYSNQTKFGIRSISNYLIKKGEGWKSDHNLVQVLAYL